MEQFCCSGCYFDDLAVVKLVVQILHRKIRDIAAGIVHMRQILTMTGGL